MSKPLTDAAARAGLERVAELATGVASHGSTLGRDGRTPVQRIIANQGPLKGASFAADGPSSGELWCWDHQTRADGPRGCGCEGERIIIHDPTGEAMLTPDSASVDLSLLKDNLLQAEHCLEQVLLVLGRWPGPRDPSLFDMDATEGCFAHRRIGTFREPHARREVQPGQVYRLCKWCAYQWFDQYGVLPTEAILKAHDSGQGRLRVREDGAVIHAGQVIDRVQLKQEASA